MTDSALQFADSPRDALVRIVDAHVFVALMLNHAERRTISSLSPSTRAELCRRLGISVPADVSAAMQFYRCRRAMSPELLLQCLREVQRDPCRSAADIVRVFTHPPSVDS